MAVVQINVYKNQFGYSLCIEDRKRDGYRAAGPKMDGTNRSVCNFLVNSDDLVNMIQDCEFDPTEGDAE